MNSTGGVQVLPHAQQEAFKGLVKAYEAKAYKKGLKLAEQVLRTCPDHGETLAMKGLTLNSMDKPDEAMELVKLGLRNNIGSYICWHVLGLVYRSHHQYAQAIKSYRNALRLESGNSQITRDLMLLQIHLHDVDGFCVTAMEMLQLQPSTKSNWLAVAIGNHLKGDHARAITIIDTFVQNELQANGGEPLPLSYEGSELQLFRNDMLVEQGLFAEALAHLDEKEPVIVDRYAFVQRRGRLMLRLGRFDEARAIYREFLDRGPDNWHTHLGFQAAVLGRDCGEPNGLWLPSNSGELGDEDKAKLVEAYAELAQAFPRSAAVQRIPLNLLAADSAEFRTQATAYLRKRLNKGVPSLFIDLRDLYSPSEPEDLAGNAHVAAIADIVLGFKASLEECGRFPNTEEGELEEPTSLLWTKYFLVQHYDKLGDLPTALQLLDECQAAHPRLVDLFQRRARLLKHGGDLQAAAAQMDAGRELDLSDRYSNNKTTKYLLRADQRAEAEATIGLFTKHDGDPMQQLHDMQVLWFELEHGESSLRQGDFGPALKKFLAVEKHYHDFRENQFDFHSYCMRKVTLRAYVANLKASEKLMGHRHFCRGAKGAIQTYLAMMAASEQQAFAESDDAYVGLSAGEKKKAKAKARKEAKAREEENARLAAEEAEEAKARLAEARRRNRSGRVPEVDADPNGRKLLDVEPVVEAQRLVSLLQQHAPTYVWTHLLAYDVARKRGKWLQALRAIVRARAVGGEGHPEAFVRTVEFLRDAAAARESFPHAVDAVIQAETAEITHGQSLELFVNDYHRHHGERMPQRLAAARALFAALPSAHARAVTWATELSGREVTLKNCVAAHSALASLGASAEQADAFKATCAAKFPLATYFSPSS